ncbi:MAG: aldo/keto reductase [Ferruginibacter sp.]|nr:aldo/keto reductase [Cytophagales bacterium]
MKYNQLGNSDLRVGEIGFGCMSLGEDHAQNANVLHRALDGGINLFDTADLYGKGHNEISVGRAFKGMRQKVVLATKVGNQWRQDGSGWDWNPNKAYILQAAEESLQRLQTDYLDLYQLHGGTLDDPTDETIEAFEQLRQQGKIRHYGLSSIRPNVIREYVQRSNIAGVMMQYSLLDRRPEESCLALLSQHRIGVLARGSLAKGLLVNKPAAPYLDYSEAEVRQATTAVRALTDNERNAAGVALRFTLSHPAVTSAVVGIRTPGQLAEVLLAGDAPPLTPEEVRRLTESVRINAYAEHR